MLRRTLSLFICIFFITSCRDHLKIEANDLPQGYADSQVIGNWKITGFTADKPYDWNRDGITETNIYNTWSECEKDNLYSFSPDKTGSFKIHCTANYTGIWSIVDTKYLEYYLNPSALESEKLISMTAVEFKTTIAITDANGQNIELTRTWVRQ
jgi:hypothetical protein